MFIPLIVLVALAGSPETPDVGPLVRALRLVQRYGTPEALSPANDERVKSTLAKAIAKDGRITLPELGGFMESDVFGKLAGPDGSLDQAEIAKALETEAPESRAKLLPALRSHADYLATTFDMISPAHREAGEKLAEWIAAHYEPGKPLHVTIVCTGNSRRSALGAAMGNVAAAYYGLPELRFHSGGTAPTAFNSRTITALQATGFDIDATGREAPRGEPKTENPVYHVAWGQGLESLEFSKLYHDSANPQEGFAALMVCSEADEECPVVKGAAMRISMPFLDPKIYDGSSYETAKYAERRDDIGRVLLAVLLQARAKIAGRTAVAH